VTAPHILALARRDRVGGGVEDLGTAAQALRVVREDTLDWRPVRRRTAPPRDRGYVMTPLCRGA
jgi:hypothetical protein